MQHCANSVALLQPSPGLLQPSLKGIFPYRVTILGSLTCHFMYHSPTKHLSRLKVKLAFQDLVEDFQVPVCLSALKCQQCNGAYFSMERISKHTIPLVIISNIMPDNI